MTAVGAGDLVAECRLRETLRRYLERAPLAWATPRAQEAVFLGGLGLPSPVLDLGCGDGLFAWLSGTLAGAVGVDLDPREVRRAARRGVYRAVLVADGRALPFTDRSFGSVVSVSTLEHVGQLDRVLAEAARVLRPGGRLAYSVPGPEFAASLLWPRLFGTVGWERPARAYRRWVDGLFRHVNLFSADQWRERLERHGLAVLAVHPFNPRAAGIWQDVGYATSLGSAALRRLTGRWVLWPPGRRLPARLLTAALVPSLRGPGASGTCLGIYAEARVDR